MKLHHSLMSDRKLGVRRNCTAPEMLEQLQCNYKDWLAEGHPEAEVFKTLCQRVLPLVNGHCRWPQAACRRLAVAWREFTAWRDEQCYIRERMSAGAAAGGGAEPGSKQAECTGEPSPLEELSRILQYPDDP